MSIFRYVYFIIFTSCVLAEARLFHDFLLLLYYVFNSVIILMTDSTGRINAMETKKFIYYQENDVWVGWLEEYPDYRTQGKTIDELKVNLKDIYDEINTGNIPHVRKYGELAVG